MDGSARFIGVFLKNDPEDVDDEAHGYQKYACITSAGNGKLYAPPNSAKRVLEIDPSRSSARAVGQAVCEELELERI